MYQVFCTQNFSEENNQIKILDFGCGAGRDTKFFIEKGFNVSAIDGSKNLCDFASIYTGIKVKECLFENWKEEPFKNIEFKIESNPQEILSFFGYGFSTGCVLSRTRLTFHTP